MFLGYVQLGNTLVAPVQTVDASARPLDADAAPRRVVYAPTGLPVGAAAGQGALMHTGAVTNASNASPIQITSSGHGLQTGVRVTVSGVGGNTNANTTTTVTVVDANNFTLDGTTGNGAYTSGGTWHVSGLYAHSVVCSAGNGFAQGNTYVVLSAWAISASPRAELDSFTVV